MTKTQIALGCSNETLGVILVYILLKLTVLFALWILGSLLVAGIIWTVEHWRSFRVRCDGCNGTGLCMSPNPLFPHSCNGDCKRVYVPESWVPTDFKGNWHEPGERFLDLYYWPHLPGTYPDNNKRYALIGCGWIKGSLWQRLRRSGPRKQLGVQGKPHPPETAAPKVCQHHAETRP